MEGQLILSVGLIAPLILEGIKYLVRLVISNPAYDFSPFFYETMIPIVTALTGIGLGYLQALSTGVSYVLPLTWVALVEWVVAAVLSVIAYNAGIKPFKVYRAEKLAGK